MSIKMQLTWRNGERAGERLLQCSTENNCFSWNGAYTECPLKSRARSVSALRAPNSHSEVSRHGSFHDGIALFPKIKRLVPPSRRVGQNNRGELTCPLADCAKNADSTITRRMLSSSRSSSRTSEPRVIPRTQLHRTA